jgi:hypothetical protein
VTFWAPRGGLAADIRFVVRFFLGLVVIGYIVLKLIVYLTTVLAHHLISGTWKFF